MECVNQEEGPKKRKALGSDIVPISLEHVAAKYGSMGCSLRKRQPVESHIGSSSIQSAVQ